MAEALTNHPDRPDAAVAHVLQTELTSAELLADVRLIGSPERYTRNLVFSGVNFSVLAIVWMPGQMSPIHAHRWWCVLGLRNGSLVETRFVSETSGMDARRRLRLDSCRHIPQGMVSHAPPDAEEFHRIANLGNEPAVSLHVYGVPSDQLGRDLNIMWES